MNKRKENSVKEELENEVDFRYRKPVSDILKIYETMHGVKHTSLDVSLIYGVMQTVFKMGVEYGEYSAKKDCIDALERTIDLYKQNDNN